MMITSFNVKKSSKENSLIAYGAIVFDGAFAVHDIKIIEKEDKIFIAMPSRKLKNDSFIDICHPITSKARELIEGILIEGAKILNSRTENKLSFNLSVKGMFKDFYSLTIDDYEIAEDLYK